MNRLQMPLGTAIGRLNTLQGLIHAGIAQPEHRDEYRMILEALNAITLDLGFDCNGDGIADDVNIFKQSAQTGCCALQTLEEEKVDRSKMEKRKKLKSSRRG
jgi:hypothetical protein